MREETLQSPAREPESVEKAGWSWNTKFIIFCHIIFILIFIIACNRYGSLRNALSFFSTGQLLYIEPAHKTFGTAAPGEQVVVPFRLTNRGRDAIRVVGSTVGCSCTVPDDMPFRIAPGRSRTFHVTIKVPNEPGPVEMPIVLYTSIPDQSRINLRITGTIISKSRQKEGG